VLFEQKGGPHPGFTDIRLTELDATGKYLGEWKLRTAWRSYVTGVSFATMDKEQYPVFILGTYMWPNGVQISVRSYYAKIGTRYDLIRLENAGGDPERNVSSWTDYRHGSVPPTQTPDQWQADLESRDRYMILRALVWLGGEHLDSRAAEQPNRQFENAHDVALVREVRSRAKVLARLRELAASKDRWLREEAELVLHPHDVPR
jgi:hypothetical protein